MRFGVGLFPTGPASDMVRRAALAEELGFDVFWVADTHLIWREAWVLLGAIAQQTARIAIGPGVTHPIVRHPSVIAAAIHTLSELAPGRVRLGIGIGDSGPANMGLPRASLAQLEAAVRDIKALLLGDSVSSNGTSLRLAYASGEPVSVYVAGASDRTQRMAGRVAGGAFVAGALDELSFSVDAIHAGEREAGRPDGATDVVLFNTACVDEDEELARDTVRAVVARKATVALGRAERTGRLADRDREPLARLRQAYDSHHHMEPRYNELVPEHWVDRFALGGTPTQVLESCQRAAMDGANEISIVFVGKDLERQMRAFSEAVIARMK